MKVGLKIFSLFKLVPESVPELPLTSEHPALAGRLSLKSIATKTAVSLLFLTICAFLAVCLVGLGSVLFVWYTNHPACDCYSQQLSLARVAWNVNKHIIETIAVLFFLVEIILLRGAFFNKKLLVSILLSLLAGAIGFVGYQYFFESNSYTNYYLLIMSPLIVSYDYRELAEQFLDPILTKKFLAGTALFVLSFGLCWLRTVSLSMQSNKVKS